MEITSKIGIDQQRVYHFGYPVFGALPGLMTKIYSFHDLNNNTHFLLHRLRLLLELCTDYIVGHRRTGLAIGLQFFYITVNVAVNNEQCCQHCIQQVYAVNIAVNNAVNITVYIALKQQQTPRQFD